MYHKRMTWLNYHHLLYFWVVAKKGTITAACRELSLAQPTISAQLRALENALGHELFDRSRRKLALTETGRIVYGYADEIFSVGQNLMDALEGLARVSIGDQYGYIDREGKYVWNPQH